MQRCVLRDPASTMRSASSDWLVASPICRSLSRKLRFALTLSPWALSFAAALPAADARVTQFKRSTKPRRCDNRRPVTLKLADSAFSGCCVSVADLVTVHGCRHDKQTVRPLAQFRRPYYDCNPLCHGHGAQIRKECGALLKRELHLCCQAARSHAQSTRAPSSPLRRHAFFTLLARCARAAQQACSAACCCPL
jgi:hypothetical protein